MSDLISRKRLEEEIRADLRQSDMPAEWEKGVRWAFEHIHEAPAVDVATYCDVIEDCTQCPRYADDCDGREKDADRLA